MSRFSAPLFLVAIFATSSFAQQPADGKGAVVLAPYAKALEGHSGFSIPCKSGLSAGFPCLEIDLLSFMTLSELYPDQGTPSRASDVWGWTDSETGNEYAILGLNFGTAFIDVSDPVNPVLVGTLPRTPEARVSVWRDIKVYADHAFIVSDGAGSHGMQVFDLTQLRGRTTSTEFGPTALYFEFGSAHNVAINTETGFAYVLGANSGGDTCGGGLHMVDIRNPTRPTFAGCFADSRTGFRGTGYSHDAQCVVYHGPDAQYQGREICIGFNETSISIADVTDKGAPVPISIGRYPDFGYVHQGWLTDDHRYLLVDDESDEWLLRRNTHTKIFDLTELDVPVMVSSYEASTASTDHNLYVNGIVAYQSNYTAGLRLLDLRDPENPEEIAYFDTTPADSAVGFGGTWSVYPFFESGIVVVSSINEGLFVLQPNASLLVVPEETAVSSTFPNPFNANTTFAVVLTEPEVTSIVVFDALGRHVRTLHEGLLAGGRFHQFVFDGSDLPSGTYIIRVAGETFATTRSVTLVK